MPHGTSRFQIYKHLATAGEGPRTVYAISSALH